MSPNEKPQSADRQALAATSARAGRSRRGGWCGFRLSGAALGLVLLAWLASPLAALEAVVPVDESGDAETLLVSYNATGKIVGVNLSELLGADRFYENGFYGNTTTSVVIDAQLAWNSHALLTKVDTFYVGSNTSSSSDIGTVGSHATAVASIVGGYYVDGSEYNGIAPMTTLQSGAIATAVYSDGSFDASDASYLNTYLNALNTSNPDVINSSWGYSDATGNNTWTLAMDSMAWTYANTTFVISSGNSGQGNNTVSGPASGYNTISVGAVGITSGNTAGTDYTTIASYSSGGPADFYNPVTGETVTGVRAAVDIVAPGTYVVFASTTSSVALATGNGTSYAAPIVSGGVALLKDASKQTGLASTSLDTRVIKAVLMNSADKLDGWDNGQHLVGNVVVTTQSLDWYQGAGMMNLTRAYDQYLTGTTDVSGYGGGTVQKIGWDLGQVGGTSGSSTYNDYTINSTLLAGQILDVTLTWFRNTTTVTLDSNDTISVSDDGLANLDLEIWDSNLTTLYATSNSTYNSSEELHYTIANNGTYLIRVLYDGQVYGEISSELYGLAWAVVPEPGVIAALAGLGLTGLLVWRRRRRRLAALPPQPEPYFSSEETAC